MAQRHRGDQGVVGDLHPVEDFEPFPQAAQDRDGILHRGLIDEHRLEPAFQRRVLLDVLAVLVQGGRADHVQLTAGEHRLEHVPRVHRALGGARPDHRVQLVDEQQDAPVRRLHLIQDRLEALLELAAVLGPGHQRAHVEGEDGPVPQALGHVAAGDPLGQALDDRGLAHAGIAGQDGVVLGLAGQDLDHPPDLAVPADDRVELARLGVGDQVAAVLLQRLVGGLGRGRGHPLASPDGGQRLQEAVAGQPRRCQQPPGRRLLPLREQRDDQVLDRDVVVLEPLGLLLGRIEQPGQPLGHRHLARCHARAADPRPPRELGLQVRPQTAGVAARGLQQPRRQPLGLIEQRQQQVLAVNLGVPEAQRPGLRVVQRFLGLLGQAVRVHGRPPLRCGLYRRLASAASSRSSRSRTRPSAA